MNQKEQALEFHLIKQELASFCSFSLGRKAIEQLRPSFRLIEVNQQLAYSSEALKLAIFENGINFSGVKDINPTVTEALKDQVCGANELLDVATHFRSCQRIQKQLLDHQLQLQQLGDLASSLNVVLSLSDQIESCINQYGEVRIDASKTLQSLNDSLLATQQQLRHIMQQIVAQQKDILMDDIIATRNERMVVLVKAVDKNKLPGIIHGESSSGQAVYIEPMATVALNNKKQEIEEGIKKEIQRILMMLSQAVKIEAIAIQANLQTLQLLDQYNAIGLWGKKHEAVIASVNTQSRLYLKQARHPLIDPKQVVSNTYRLMPPYQTLLISGPNTGGKTVSLKTIGLFVWMTHCGMPVPCESAEVPLVDNIFVDIGDDQSIVSSLSTFSAHLQKQAIICQQATNKSLVLLDELGGGTDPKEGESLAIAILSYLSQQGSMVVVTTHLSGLKTYAKARDEILVASVEFDSVHFRPTYRFSEGFVGQSNAIDIAKRYGLKTEIIELAKQTLNSLKTDEEKLMERLEREKTEIQTLQQQLDQEKQQVAQLKQQLLQQQQALRLQQQQALDKIKQEQETLLQETLDELEQLYDQMKKSKAKHDLKEGQAIINKVRHQVDKVVEKTYHELTIGDRVRHKNANHTGTLEAIDKNKAIINVNGIKMTVKLKDLVFVSDQPKETVKKPKNRIEVNRPKTVAMELNLIGQRVSEALPLLDKHLDQCLLNNQPYTLIIHGVGTGQLKKAVHQALAKYPFVKSFELAPLSQGGSGATIVKLGS